MEQNQNLSTISDKKPKILGMNELNPRGFTIPPYNPYMGSSYPTNCNNTMNVGMPNQNFGTSHMIV